MKYIYPAVFKFEDDAIIVNFPDIPGCYTNGKSLEDAFENAEDALALMLYVMEEGKDKIPSPTPLADIPAPKGSDKALIKVDTLAVRKMNDKRSVHKNITIPGWLDAVAREHNVNFSRLLQNAICRECGVEL